jgi:hypothetical protein
MSIRRATPEEFERLTGRLARQHLLWDHTQAAIQAASRE